MINLLGGLLTLHMACVFICAIVKFAAEPDGASMQHAAGRAIRDESHEMTPTTYCCSYFRSLPSLMFDLFFDCAPLACFTALGLVVVYVVLELGT